MAATLAFWLLGVATICTNWEKQVSDILPSLPTNFTTPRYKMTHHWMMQNSFIFLFPGNEALKYIRFLKSVFLF